MKALKGDGLTVALQPIVDAKTHKPYCEEALLRFKADDNSAIGKFINVAERFNKINQVDAFVFRKVFNLALRNTDNIYTFNLSTQTINCDDWLPIARQLAKASPEAAGRMIIEITETFNNKNEKKVKFFCDEVKRLGFKIALDDFGTGYTSFQQLKELPLDYIKIDGSYIKDLKKDSRNYHFIKALSDLSHALGAKTIAEFVETESEATQLTELGLDYLQGYHFGRPEILKEA